MLALLALILLTLVQRSAISQLRLAQRENLEELQHLRARSNEVQRLEIQEAEIIQLRENTRDLLRLRNEVRQLRDRQEETELLQAANTQLLQLLQGVQLSPAQESQLAAVRKRGALLGIVLRSAFDPQGEHPTGAVVSGIQPDSPAATSDLKPGDVIVRLDGRSIENGAQMQAEMLTRKPGETVLLDVIRKDQAIRVPLKTGAWPP
jgi:C-terminal processing protease CtpA/Prc